MRGISSVRSSATLNALPAEQPPPRTPTILNNAEQPPSARSAPGNRTLDFSPSTRTMISTRSTQPSNANNDQPPSARSVSGRPSGLSKVVPMVPPSVPITLRPASSVGVPPSEPLIDVRKDRRYAATAVLSFIFPLQRNYQTLWSHRNWCFPLLQLPHKRERQMECVVSRTGVV